LGREQESSDVDVEDPHESVRVQIERVLPLAIDTGRGNQDVQAPAHAGGRGDRRIHRLPVRDVRHLAVHGHAGRRRGPCRLDRRGDLGGVAAHEEHVGALCHQPARSRQPDARGPTGHQRRPSQEPSSVSQVHHDKPVWRECIVVMNRP
jgi:hypothetical protein